jgi:D-alanyl-D-alanine carboxypeptidase/D-alanyl-D-alanine-endopeptidase (penicillin-binding protein 4)
LGLLWIGSTSLSANARPRGDEDPATIELREAVARIVRRVRRGRVAVRVEDLSGTVLYDNKGNVALNPASNAKILTAVAVLQVLGGEHRFHTRLRGTRSGVDGQTVDQLVVEGAGDPALQTHHLDAVAQSLATLGVRRIHGPLLVDTSALPLTTDPPGFAAFRSSSPYRAPIGALSLNDNVVRITVRPGEKRGRRAIVTASPESSYFEFRGNVRTTERRTRLYVSTYRKGDKTGVIVSGRIGRGTAPRRFWRRVFHPNLYGARTLIERLRAHGIQLGDRVQQGAPARVLPVLAEHRSASTFEILRSAIKRSSNVQAELLLLAMGARQRGKPATYPKALAALSDVLARLGVRPGNYRVINGSGLARKAQFRPRDMVRVLRGAYTMPILGPELMAALPQGGIDGTLRRRLRHLDVKGYVRAKTGTLSGVTCLSGYAGYGGRVIIFSMMAYRVSRLGPVRTAQDRLASQLVAHLRGLARAPAVAARRETNATGTKAQP